MTEKKKPSQGSNKLQIRNSTVDFLVFTRDAHEEGIEVRVQDHDVWLTQNAIGQLFDVDRSVVTKHLKNIYESGELSEDATCAKFAQVADNGKTYQYKFYSWWFTITFQLVFTNFQLVFTNFQLLITNFQLLITFFHLACVKIQNGRIVSGRKGLLDKQSFFYAGNGREGGQVQKKRAPPCALALYGPRTVQTMITRKRRILQNYENGENETSDVIADGCHTYGIQPDCPASCAGRGRNGGI